MLNRTNKTIQTNRRREIISYNNVQLDVIVEGEGPKIIMLPSLGRTSDDYDDVAAVLASNGYMVLRPQPRGLGQSRGPMENITLKDFARDVTYVIEYFGGEKSIIIGHAFGNFVARMTAALYPQVVKGIVIAAAADKDYSPLLSENIKKIADPSVPEAEKLILLQKTFFAPNNNPSVWLDGWHPEVRQSQTKAKLATKREEWWSGGEVPMLDLQASDDPFKLPQNRHELKDEFGERVTVVVIPNASHALLPEQPQEVVEAVIEWVSQL